MIIRSSLVKIKQATSSCSFKTFARLDQIDQSKLPVANQDKNEPSGLLGHGKVKIFEIMSIYEEAIGLKEIKEAQNNVLEAEKNFVAVQKERRLLNTELLGIQGRVRDLRDEMERLSRTDSRFLKLFTEEHSILKRETTLVNEYKQKEDEERNSFFMLSASLRDSQEKERARVERTKYLQLGLSIACTSLGIVSAFLLSYFRSSSIKEILRYEEKQFESMSILMKDINGKQIELEAFLKDKLPIPVNLVAENKELPVMVVDSPVEVESQIAEEIKPINLSDSLPRTRNILITTSLLLASFYYMTRN